MVFSIGIMAALVSIWRRNRESRLKNLQTKLKKKDPSREKIYQYPVKKIFCIIFLIAFGICLEWFCFQYEKDLRHHLTHQYFYSQIEPVKVQSIQILQANNSTELTHQLHIKRQIRESMSSLKTVLRFIHLGFFIALIALLLDLDLRVVTVTKNNKKVIKVTNHRMLGLSVEHQSYTIEQGDRLTIWEMGESRFTSTNYYFSVRVVNRKSSSWGVISRACMFDARSSVVRLAHHLDLPFSTKIRKIQHHQQHNDIK